MTELYPFPEKINKGTQPQGGCVHGLIGNNQSVTERKFIAAAVKRAAGWQFSRIAFNFL